MIGNGRRRPSRWSIAWAAAVLAVGLSFTGDFALPLRAAGVGLAPGLRIEVVAMGIPRPAQLAFSAPGSLIVLSHGWRGDSAAEIFWLDPASPQPVDGSLAPRVVVPFAEGPRKAVLGSLAVDARTGGLFLGEENGNRIYRLTSDQRLTPVAVGLNHLLGGSSLAADQQGRLMVLDYASFESQLRSESPPPSSLESLAAENYTGPIVFRIDPDRHSGTAEWAVIAPFFPPPPMRRVPGEPMHRFVAIAPLEQGEFVVLSSIGEMVILSAEGKLRSLARLPSGHFHRTSMAVAPDGSVLVSAGFHIREVYRVSSAGVVTSLAHDLGDPQGVAVDRSGAIYIAETALHRIVRIVATGR